MLEQSSCRQSILSSLALKYGSHWTHFPNELKICESEHSVKSVMHFLLSVEALEYDWQGKHCPVSERNSV